MRRSAFPASFCWLALLLLVSCRPPESGPAAEKAEAAWKLYLDRPDPNTYENFIRANRAAAYAHAMPHDRAGIEYQLRAFEVEASEAVRTGDAHLADDVTEAIAEIGRKDLTGVYEEAHPGARARLEAAKALAERVGR